MVSSSKAIESSLIDSHYLPHFLNEIFWMFVATQLENHHGNVSWTKSKGIKNDPHYK